MKIKIVHVELDDANSGDLQSIISAVRGVPTLPCEPVKQLPPHEPETKKRPYLGAKRGRKPKDESIKELESIPAGASPGEILKAARKAAGMSQQDLAEKIDVKGSTICIFEKHGTGIGPDRLRKIGLELGLERSEMAILVGSNGGVSHDNP